MKALLLCVAAPIAVVLLVLPTAADDQPPTKSYRSPYSVQFTHPLGELIGDLEREGRGNPHEESSVPFGEWYSRRIREKYGHWGPPAQHYPAPRAAAGRSVAWARERVLAVALRFQGYSYQHHHIPDWNPPADWPWEKVALGHNSKGVDCSNFTAFAYNQALGLKPTGAVKRQAEELEVPGPGPGRTTRAERIELPESYAERVRTLQTGDLLFIRNVRGEISHVVLWVGSIGRAPDDAPLILDSHGDGVRDCRGETIPAGIHLRPFLEKSWYGKSASHALRILHGK